LCTGNRFVCIGAALGDADTSDADISVTCISDVSSVTLHDDDDVDSIGEMDRKCSLLASAHTDTEAALAMLTDTVLCLIKTEEQMLLPNSVRFQLGVKYSHQHQQQLFEQVRRHDELLHALHTLSSTARNPFAIISMCKCMLCYVNAASCFLCCAPFWSLHNRSYHH
jgi:hypothetical protein